MSAPNDTSPLPSRLSIIVYRTQNHRNKKCLIVKLQIDARCATRFIVLLSKEANRWPGMDERKEAILLTFSNLINLLLIEGYRNILHYSMFVRRNKWINFRSVFVHLCFSKLMRNDQESYAWHEVCEKNSFRHNWDTIVYIQKGSIRRDSEFVRPARVGNY